MSRFIIVVDYLLQVEVFSSAVPSGSGAFLMPSCPSSVCPSVRPSRLRGGEGPISETLQ